ncbi:hypothetical protein D3C85_1549930 [compost metagenome]
MSNLTGVERSPIALKLFEGTWPRETVWSMELASMPHAPETISPIKRTVPGLPEAGVAALAKEIKPIATVTAVTAKNFFISSIPFYSYWLRPESDFQILPYRQLNVCPHSNSRSPHFSNTSGERHQHCFLCSAN